ncbi:MAG: molybdopterin cofactor-binding domain-containing protein, partial [Pseudomonadales bacterium]
MPLPAALEQNPLLSNWVAFEGDDIIVRTGKVELGQGIKTAIAIIAAEELSVPVTRITVRTGSTSAGPNEFITAGSMSIEGSGSAVRQACAEVRSYLLGLAAGTFGVEPGELTIEEGIIKHPATNETASFAELMDGQSLNIIATGDAVPVPVESYKLVGKTATRVDLLAKITGGAAYVQDLAETDTLHARIVRPPSMAYTLSTLNEIDKSSVEQMQGVLSVIVDGNFVAVLAEDEYTASLAKFKLQQAIVWKPSPEKRLPADIHEYLEKNAGVSLLVEQGTPLESTIPPRRTHGETLKATYRKPYHMHGSIGPSAATARWQGNKLYVRSHSQGPYLIRGALAAALAMPPEDIVVEHAENAGCYGHNGAD